MTDTAWQAQHLVYERMVRAVDVQSRSSEPSTGPPMEAGVNWRGG